ncbi:MAG: hypothetical protein E6Q97_15005 [Desulfurellales bacterium]|nr:MAG: hypothetical protein E6Q97_15005 [Desulfurellales bacterium]
MNNTEAVQHAATSGMRSSIKIAEDPGPDPNLYKLSRDVDRGFRFFMRKRGLMDEERHERLVEQAAKARKVKAQRRACK